MQQWQLLTISTSDLVGTTAASLPLLPENRRRSCHSNGPIGEPIGLSAPLPFAQISLVSLHNHFAQSLSRNSGVNT